MTSKEPLAAAACTPGFIVSDHAERRADFQRDMLRWLGEGEVIDHETVVDGLANAPQAFMGLFKGENVGKMLVRIGNE